MLFRHEPCIRRRIRHEPLLIGCRIHPETYVPVRRVSRLAEPGRTCSDRDEKRTWSLVWLALAQHPIACLGEVAGDGDDGAAVSLPRSEAVVELPDMAVAMSLESDRTRRGFDEAPLEILVDVAAGATVPDASSAGDDAWHETGVAGQVLGAWEAVDFADLQPDERREDLADTRHSAQQADLGRGLEGGCDAIFNAFDLDFKLIERGELHPDHRRRIAGQPVECGVDVNASFDAEQIADADCLQAVAVEGGVDAMLQR